MKKNISVTFLVPTYNDEETISHLIEHIIQTSKRLAITERIHILNDASTDKTPKLIHALKEKYPQVFILQHTVNRGYGETIRDLYMSVESSWMMSLPGDYQFEPDEIEKLLPYMESADMIIGQRKRREDTLFRKSQSRIYNFLLKFLFQLPITDVNSIRLMKSDILKSFTLTTTSAFVDAELVIRASSAGFHVIEIPIQHKERATGGATGGKFFKTILPTIIDMLRFRFHRE